MPARRVAARIGDGRVARLGNRTTIAFTGRLALTNSGCNAHVFHDVGDSKQNRRIKGGAAAFEDVHGKPAVPGLESEPQRSGHPVSRMNTVGSPVRLVSPCSE